MANDQYKQFNCYQILQISPDATPGEIKAAMRKASLKSHPDRGGSHAEQAKINIAYEILSDPVQRQAHDIYWKVRVRSSTSSQQTNRSQQSNRGQDRAGDRSTGSGTTSSATQSFAGFKRRVDAAIQTKKASIWTDLERLKQKQFDDLSKRFHGERTAFYALAGAGISIGVVAVQFPLLWIVTAFLLFRSALKLNGIGIGDQTIGLFADDISQKLGQQAHTLAAKDCHDQAAALDRYNSDLASIVQLVTRPSSFDDSEIQVARRLVTALFLNGYRPSYYDSEARTILFTDQDERLLVRFRHRSGTAVNVSYVDRLVQLMGLHQASSGLLFCSPGLSGNAAQLAARQRIKSYTLESMNTWIDQVLESDRVGPTGDVLASLDALRNFLSGITPQVNQWRRRRRRF